MLPVILFHAGFELFSGGFVGVDVFFVISGYLITTIILAELEQGKFSIVNFYERRARRILPALFLVMLVCIPFAWFWLLPSDMKDFSKSFVAVSVFASNILFWRESGYFDTAAELKPLLHTWSLAVEEQYYVIFPLFLMLFWKLGKRWILVVLGLVFVASLAVAQWGAYAKPAAAFYLLPTRGWELLIGAFAAFYLSQANRKVFGKGLSEFGGWLGVALIIYTIFAYSKTTPFPGFYALVPTSGTLLIILFATQQTTVGKFVGNKAFVGIGLISYSAYLWHQPLFAFARHIDLEEPTRLMLGVLSVTSVVIAYFSWKYVESPFRDKLLINRKQIFVFSASVSIVFISIGFFGSTNKFLELRFDPKILAELSAVNPKISCAQDYQDIKAVPCVLGDLRSSKLIIAVGDSHMAQWADLLQKIGTERGIRIEMFSKSACANASIEYFYSGYGKIYKECAIWRDNVVRKIKRRNPRLVFLTNSSAGYVRVDSNYPSVADWKDGVSRFLDQIVSDGYKVLWLGDNPRFWKLNPLNCWQRMTLFELDHGNCSSPRNQSINSDILNVEREVVLSKSAVYADFTNFYCNATECNSIIQNVPIMRDSNHLSVSATMMLKEEVERLILPLLK